MEICKLDQYVGLNWAIWSLFRVPNHRACVHWFVAQLTCDWQSCSRDLNSLAKLHYIVNFDISHNCILLSPSPTCFTDSKSTPEVNMDFGLFCCLCLFIFGRLKALELKHVSSKICWDELAPGSPDRSKQTFIFNHFDVSLKTLVFGVLKTLVFISCAMKVHFARWNYWSIEDGNSTELDAWKQWGQRWKGNAVVGWTPVQVERVKAL